MCIKGLFSGGTLDLFFVRPVTFGTLAYHHVKASRVAEIKFGDQVSSN
jgi:hypothetical protein